MKERKVIDELVNICDSEFCYENPILVSDVIRQLASQNKKLKDAICALEGQIQKMREIELMLKALFEKDKKNSDRELPNDWD